MGGGGWGHVGGDSRPLVRFCYVDAARFIAGLVIASPSTWTARPPCTESSRTHGVRTLIQSMMIIYVYKEIQERARENDMWMMVIRVLLDEFSCIGLLISGLVCSSSLACLLPSVATFYV